MRRFTPQALPVPTSYVTPRRSKCNQSARRNPRPPADRGWEGMKTRTPSDSTAGPAGTRARTLESTATQACHATCNCNLALSSIEGTLGSHFVPSKFSPRWGAFNVFNTSSGEHQCALTTTCPNTHTGITRHRQKQLSPEDPASIDPESLRSCSWQARSHFRIYLTCPELLPGS